MAILYIFPKYTESHIYLIGVGLRTGTTYRLEIKANR